MFLACSFIIGDAVAVSLMFLDMLFNFLVIIAVMRRGKIVWKEELDHACASV